MYLYPLTKTALPAIKSKQHGCFIYSYINIVIDAHTDTTVYLSVYYIIEIYYDYIQNKQ